MYFNKCMSIYIYIDMCGPGAASLRGRRLPAGGGALRSDVAKTAQEILATTNITSTTTTTTTTANTTNNNKKKKNSNNHKNPVRPSEREREQRRLAATERPPRAAVRGLPPAINITLYDIL